MIRSPSRFLGVLFALSLAALISTGWAGGTQAADGTWNVDSTGNWGIAANWLDGKMADGAGTTANVTFDITANDRGPAIDGAAGSRTVGILNLGDRNATHSYTITADSGGRLIFDNGGSNARINQLSTSFGDMIVAPIQLKGSLDITNLSGDRTLTIAGGGITSIATGGVQVISNVGTAAGDVTISGVIGDGSSGGRIALLQNNPGDILTLSGTNTFSGGVMLIAGTLKIANATALGAAGGKLTITGGTLESDGRTIVNNNPQDWNGDFTYCGAGGNLDLGAGAVTMSGSRKVTVGAGGSVLAVGGAIGDGGGGYGLTKLGAGALVLNGSAASTFTGGLSVRGGTLELNFANMDAPTDLIPRGNALTLGGGTLTVTGKTGALSTSQTFAGLTIVGGSRIFVNPGGGIGTTVSLGSIATVNAVGRSLLIGKLAGAGSGSDAITTTDVKDGRGIYGGRVVYTSDGGATADWATTASAGSPYTLDAYGGYTTMAAGAASDSANAVTGSLVLTGSHTHNTLKLTSGSTLALGANTLTLFSGGLLSTGTSASVISGVGGAGRLMGGNGSGGYDLIVHQHNTGGLTISAVIGDNGTHATALTKCGAGTLVLSGNNTYGGETTVSAGTLKLSTAGNNNIAHSARITVAQGAILDVTAVTGAGGFTVVGGQTLGGSGTVVGTVAVSAGGTIAPGASCGPLNAGTKVTMAAGAIYHWEFDGTNADQVNVLGDLTLAPEWKLAIVGAGGVAPACGVEYDLFTYTGKFTGSVAADIIASPPGWPKAVIARDTTPGAGRIYLTFASPAVSGDTNGDGVVDAADFIALKKNFGAGPGVTTAEGNFNDDGVVNWADLQIQMANFGSSGAATTAPEPCSATLLALGALTAVCRRRR